MAGSLEHEGHAQRVQTGNAPWRSVAQCVGEKIREAVGKAEQAATTSLVGCVEIEEDTLLSIDISKVIARVCAMNPAFFTVAEMPHRTDALEGASAQAYFDRLAVKLAAAGPGQCAPLAYAFLSMIYPGLQSLCSRTVTLTLVTHTWLADAKSPGFTKAATLLTAKFQLAAEGRNKAVQMGTRLQKYATDLIASLDPGDSPATKIKARLRGTEYAPPPELQQWAHLLVEDLVSSLVAGGLDPYLVRALFNHTTKLLPFKQTEGAAALAKERTTFFACPRKSVQAFSAEAGMDQAGCISPKRHQHSQLDKPGSCPLVDITSRVSQQHSLINKEAHTALALASLAGGPALRGLVTPCYAFAPNYKSLVYDATDKRVHFALEARPDEDYIPEWEEKAEQTQIPCPHLALRYDPATGSVSGGGIRLPPVLESIIVRCLSRKTKARQQTKGAWTTPLLNMSRFLALTLEYWQGHLSPDVVQQYDDAFLFDMNGHRRVQGASVARLLAFIDENLGSLLFYRPAVQYALDRINDMEKHLTSKTVGAAFLALQTFFEHSGSAILAAMQMHTEPPATPPTDMALFGSRKLDCDGTQAYDVASSAEMVFAMAEAGKKLANVGCSKTRKGHLRLTRIVRLASGYMLDRMLLRVAMVIAQWAVEQVEAEHTRLLGMYPHLASLSPAEQCQQLITILGLRDKYPRLGSFEHMSWGRYTLKDQTESDYLGSGNYGPAVELDALERQPNKGPVNPNHVRCPAAFTRNPFYVVAASLKLSVTEEALLEGTGYGIFSSVDEIKATFARIRTFAGPDATLDSPVCLSDTALKIVVAMSFYAAIFSGIPRRPLSFRQLRVGELAAMVHRLTDAQYTEDAPWIPSPEYVRDKGFFAPFRVHDLPESFRTRASASLLPGIGEEAVINSVANELQAISEAKGAVRQQAAASVEGRILYSHAAEVQHLIGPWQSGDWNPRTSALWNVAEALNKEAGRLDREQAGPEEVGQYKQRANTIQRVLKDIQARKPSTVLQQEGLVISKQTIRLLVQALGMMESTHAFYFSPWGKRVASYNMQHIEFTAQTVLVLSRALKVTCQDPSNFQLGVFGGPCTDVCQLGSKLAGILGINSAAVGIMPTITEARSIAITMLKNARAELTGEESQALCDMQGHGAEVQKMFYALRMGGPEATRVSSLGKRYLGSSEFSQRLAQAAVSGKTAEVDDSEEPEAPMAHNTDCGPSQQERAEEAIRAIGIYTDQEARERAQDVQSALDAADDSERAEVEANMVLAIISHSVVGEGRNRKINYKGQWWGDWDGVYNDTLYHLECEAACIELYINVLKRTNISPTDLALFQRYAKDRLREEEGTLAHKRSLDA